MAVQAEKSPEIVFLYLACLRLGAIYLPLNTAYRRVEIEYFLSDATPRLFVCTPARAEEYAALAAVAGARLETLGENGDGIAVEASGGDRVRWSAQPNRTR